MEGWEEEENFCMNKVKTVVHSNEQRRSVSITELHTF